MEIEPRSARIAGLLKRDFEWTERQREVLGLVAKARTNQEIADALGISLDGAKWHLREIFSKLGVDSREEVGEYWRARNGLLGRARLLGGTVLGSWRLVAAGAAAVAAAGSVAAMAFVLQRDDLPHAQAPLVTTVTPTATLAASPTPSPPPPRPTPRSDCFPGGCTSSSAGPPVEAPAGLEWVLELIPRLEASGILTAEIRRSLLSAQVGLNDQPAAYLWTNLGLIELMQLPTGISESDVRVTETPGASYAPSAGDACTGSNWVYQFQLGARPAQTSCASRRLFFASGNGLMAQTLDEGLIERLLGLLPARRLR